MYLKFQYNNHSKNNVNEMSDDISGFFFILAITYMK